MKLSTLPRRLINTWRARRKKDPTIDILSDGFRFVLRKKPLEIRWADIVRIDAGTKDCITIDIFFLVLFYGKNSIVIDEFCDGFRQLEHEMIQRWPQIREPWNAMYTGPAFQPRYETLWKRDS